nr:MAG TPA: hypothetical protein [Caudoviricetes sp.]
MALLDLIYLCCRLLRFQTVSYSFALYSIQKCPYTLTICQSIWAFHNHSKGI